MLAQYVPFYEVSNCARQASKMSAITARNVNSRNEDDIELYAHNEGNSASESIYFGQRSRGYSTAYSTCMKLSAVCDPSLLPQGSGVKSMHEI
jgi:hypothetical protein